MKKPIDITLETTDDPIFIHIPKTSGMSIQLNLRKHIPAINSHHRKVTYYDKSLRDRQFVFTFVRNPYDRLVSAFSYLTQGICNEKDRAKAAKFPLNFKDFVIELNHNNIYMIHMLPMTFWLDDGVNFIGRYENIQEDYNYVCSILQIPEEKLPLLNNSKHKHYSQYYDQESIDIVSKIYKKDLEAFNYDFKNNY